MSQSPFRGFCERLLGVWQYAQRPQRGAIVDGKPCITAGGAKRNLRGTDTSLSFGVEDVEQCCATSRHIIIGATSPQAAPLWACQRLSIVKHLRRFAPMWGCRKHPEYHNRGAVADPAAMGDLRRMPLPCKQQLQRLIANRHIQNAKSVK